MDLDRILRTFQLEMGKLLLTIGSFIEIFASVGIKCVEQDACLNCAVLIGAISIRLVTDYAHPII